MTHIELYVNGQLCDIQSPEKLGVRLNRVLINPYELNTKDAQYSYTITLPSSPGNDAVFGYSTIEEVKNKFNTDYSASLVVDGVTIFNGKLRMSEITPSEYKGNLVLLAKKSVKDVFGDTKMTALNHKWLVPFDDMVKSMNRYNTKSGTPECIFPMVLYGLLPKVPLDPKTSKYSEKSKWDDTVRLGIQDFPPSINCMQAIRQIFESKGSEYTIGGDAFDDERLNNLYMSYKNPTGYTQEWNWGHLGRTVIKGNWMNYKNKRFVNFETNVHRNDFDGAIRYVSDLFDSSMVDFTEVVDNGTNVLLNLEETYRTSQPDELKTRRNKLHYTVPVSGLYKIRFKASLELQCSHLAEDMDENNPNFKWNNHINYIVADKHLLDSKRYEVKLIRDFGEGDFNLTEMNFDSRFYRNNLPQDEGKGEEQVHYFPQMDNQTVMMVDPKQNERLISGFRWGGPMGHPMNPENKCCCIMAIKHGWSWDVQFSQKTKIFSAINSKPYHKIDNRPVTEDEVVEEVVENKFEVKLESKSESDKIDNNVANSNDFKTGNGELFQVVWLEKGEHLGIVTVGDEVVYSHNRKGWTQQRVDFELEITPFKKTTDWITIDNAGTGIDDNIMKWNDDPDFKENEIDLMKFLPSDEKVDEWLDNFCKAFNLQLLQTGTRDFELSVKQKQRQTMPSVLDLSDRTNIKFRSNQPLGLPDRFEVGFKINEEEQGYDTTKDNGGGFYTTDTIDGSTVTQSSSFSYNWFKQMEKAKKDEAGNDVIEYMDFPVITNKEVWTDGQLDYAEMQKKLYTDYSQRFWFRADNTYNLGNAWRRKEIMDENNDKDADFIVPVLSNTYNGDVCLHLDYKDKLDSILRTYFNVIVSNESNYTEVECYLSPDEYDILNGSTLVKFNGDLYYVASVEGYDPVNRNKTKLKLMRKIR